MSILTMKTTETTESTEQRPPEGTLTRQQFNDLRKVMSVSKYLPHQNVREAARRVRQINRDGLNTQYILRATEPKVQTEPSTE